MGLIGQPMSMEEFLGHSTRGGGGKVLKNWKEQGQFLAWLNRRSGLHCRWTHGFYKVVRFQDKAPDIWGEKIKCFETNEEVLTNQYFRDKDTGERKYPTICGWCRFLDELSKAEKAGEISWTDEVFVFTAGTKRQVMHVGGLLGMFKSDKLSDEEKTELASHNIYPKEAWKEASRAKPEYLFCVVDGKNPKNGVQVAIQTQTLGDKMKIEIGKQMKARGAKGDPFVNPYPFLWEYFENANFDDAYVVTPMIEERATPEIQKLIDGPGPDVSGFVKGHSPKMVRTLMEQYCVLDVGGWEKFFPDQPEQDSKQEPETGSAPEVGQSVAQEPEAPPADADMVACDKCEKAMLATDTKCPHCGQTYAVEPSTPAPLPPPPPPLKKRSEAKAEMAKPGPGTQQQTTVATPGGNAIDPNLFGGGEKDVPF